MMVSMRAMYCVVLLAAAWTNAEVDHEKSSGNPALCEGHMAGFTGDLQCRSSFKNECPDDLSKLAYSIKTVSGYERCNPFSADMSLKRTAKCNQQGDKVHCVKAGVVHPNQAASSVGAIMFKRTICEGGSCHTFRIGYCFNSPAEQPEQSRRKLLGFRPHMNIYQSVRKNHFLSTLAARTTDQERIDFLDYLTRNWAQAFSDNGQVAVAWKCTGADQQSFEQTLMMF